MPNAHAPEPADLEQMEPTPVAQTTLNMVAENRVKFPFQILSNRSFYAIDSNLQSEMPASAVKVHKSAQKPESKATDTDPVLEPGRAETAQPEPSVVAKAVEPARETSEVAAEYHALSFDQFAAVREQVLSARPDPSEALETQTAEVASGLPVRASGLAGLAGVALILFSLGTTRLYLRWRSPVGRSGDPDLDEE
jgi:hypothetical protein